MTHRACSRLVIIRMMNRSTGAAGIGFVVVASEISLCRSATSFCPVTKMLGIPRSESQAAVNGPVRPSIRRYRPHVLYAGSKYVYNTSNNL